MSLAPYSYRPATPPDCKAVEQLYNNTYRSRSPSASSYHHYGATPEPSHTALPTPSMSPVLRQHGPTLLPKIRPQDAAAGPSTAGGPKRTHGRMLSTSHTTRGFTPYTTSRPSVQRSVTEPPAGTAPPSPISSSSSVFGPRASSIAEPTATVTPSPGHRASVSHPRSVSASGINGHTFDGDGYPTFSDLLMYGKTAQDQSDIIPNMSLQVPYIPPIPSIETHDFAFPATYPIPDDMAFGARESSMTPPPSIDLAPIGSLLTYLTEPTQPINLVRQLTISPGRGLQNFFWWDIRNVRAWQSFSLDTMSSIPGLLPLLNFGVDTSGFPQGPSPCTTVTPGSESDLINVAAKVCFPQINAAIHLSQGSNCLSLYQAPLGDRSSGNPHFLANYQHDADRTQTGLPRGRIVGLAKSFNRWNTGMRRESPARKVDYLHGLSHLQKCMRDHSCRYGFILTEIELVCVRAGCDENGQPYFGYLEVSDAIPTKNAAPPQLFDESGTPDPVETPLTAMLALYYLLMLAKSTPLPNQPASFMDVGGPGALTRQRIWSGLDLTEAERGKDGKDKWMPEPQVGEKRDAKRMRGWVWPQDPWHKREGTSGTRRGPKKR